MSRNEWTMGEYCWCRRLTRRSTSLFVVSALAWFLFFRNYKLSTTSGSYRFTTNIGYLVTQHQQQQQKPRNEDPTLNTRFTNYTPSSHPAPLALTNTSSTPFRILCTTSEKLFGYGSYKIRCRDFKKYAETFYPPNKLQIDSVHWSEAKGVYHATIIVKTTASHFPEADLIQNSTTNLSFGVVFVDIVDQLIKESTLPKTFHVVVQNDLHGRERFPEKYQAGLAHVVPHWFNSFDADLGDTPALPPLSLRPSWKVEFEDSNNMEARSSGRGKKKITTDRAAASPTPEPPLTLAMIWDPVRSDKSHAASMVKIPDKGYDFIPLHLDFDIGTWFATRLEHGSNFTTNGFGEREAIADILNDSTRAGPYLYQLLFRRFDVLLVLAKTFRLKERYNSVQRAVSQMRSGVPVLLECVPAHADLCANDYPCGFNNNNNNNNSSRGMLETLERMKMLSVRQECVRRGIEITKRYIPRSIIDNYLQILGFPSVAT